MSRDKRYFELAICVGAQQYRTRIHFNIAKLRLKFPRRKSWRFSATRAKEKYLNARNSSAVAAVIVCWSKILMKTIFEDYVRIKPRISMLVSFVRQFAAQPHNALQQKPWKSILFFCFSALPLFFIISVVGSCGAKNSPPTQQKQQWHRKWTIKANKKHRKHNNRHKNVQTHNIHIPTRSPAHSDSEAETECLWRPTSERMSEWGSKFTRQPP